MFVTLVEKNLAKVSGRSWGSTGNELKVNLSRSDETFKSLAFLTAFQSDFELPGMKFIKMKSSVENQGGWMGVKAIL